MSVRNFVWVPMPASIQQHRGLVRKKWIRSFLGSHAVLPADWKTCKGILVKNGCIFTPRSHGLSSKFYYSPDVRRLKYIVRVKQKTQTDIFRKHFYSFFGALLLAVLFIGQNLSSAEAHHGRISQYNTPSQRWNPAALGSTDIYRVPFAVPQWDSQKTPVAVYPDTRWYTVEWHLNAQRASLVRSYEQAVHTYLGELKATRDLRRASGELGICVGLIFVFFAFHGRLIDDERLNGLT